jgi:polyhydroxybutyrate depolymerase
MHTAALLALAAFAAPPDPAALLRAAALDRMLRERGALPERPAQPVGADAFINAGRGPVPVHVPASYVPGTPAPMLILLHGYMNTGQEVEDWMQFASLVDEYGFLYLYPTGTSDIFGNPFWNATDACCDLFDEGVDDAGYLLDLVELMQSAYTVDPRRIFFAGHSNGGFMSYRMACEAADLVAAVASLSGATFLDAGDCAPAVAVHTLEMHGTSDGVISYNGGCIPFGGCYPGAVQTAQTWAGYDGCAPAGSPQPGGLDLVASLPGSETSVIRWADGCAPGGSAELWTINGGPHSPGLSAGFNDLVIEYLLAHPKPAGCPADLDGNGSVGTVDFLALLAAWGANPGHPADLDGSGAVDTIDFLALLAAWGAC